MAAEPVPGYFRFCVTPAEQAGHVQSDTDQLLDLGHRMQSQPQWTLPTVVMGWPGWTEEDHRDPMIQWCSDQAGLTGALVLVSRRVDEWAMSRVAEVTL